MPERVYKRARPRRRRRSRVRVLVQWGLLVAALLVLSSAVLGIAFAGSPETLPAGTSISGVDVAGMTPGDARTMLEQRSDKLDRVPVTFVAERQGVGGQADLAPHRDRLGRGRRGGAAARRGLRAVPRAFAGSAFECSGATSSRAAMCPKRRSISRSPASRDSSIAHGPSRRSACAGSSR